MKEEQLSCHTCTGLKVKSKAKTNILVIRINTYLKKYIKAKRLLARYNQTKFINIFLIGTFLHNGC